MQHVAVGPSDRDKIIQCTQGDRQLEQVIQ